MTAMLFLRVIEFSSVGCCLAVTLLQLASDLVPSLLNRFDFGLLALDVSFDLSHLIVELVKRPLNLLTLATKLLCLLSYLHVHFFKSCLFCRLQLLELSQTCLNLWVFSLNLIALLSYVELLLLIFFNLPGSLGDFCYLKLLLVINHDILTL